MSKHAGNRTGREAKRRARRHARKSAEGAALKAWLATNAPGALLFCRGGAHPIGLRKLARVSLEAKTWPKLPSGLLLVPAEVDPKVYMGIYRYGLSVMTMPRVLYMDGV